MTKSNFKNMRWVIIGLCFLANAINYIDRANLAIAAPHIRAELALDPATMGVIMSAFFCKSGIQLVSPERTRHCLQYF